MALPFASHSQTKDGLQFDGEYFDVTLKTETLPFSKVQLRCEPDNEEHLIDMKEVGTEGRLTVWIARFKKNLDRDITHYVFKLVINGNQYWLDDRGIHKRMPGKEYHFKYHSESQPPAWITEQVFYQIFPERFCNGDPEISPKAETLMVGDRTYKRIIKKWGEPTEKSRKTAAREFFGGDLKGIQKKLDYIQELGITALYLNPIFTSNSNHKYDTSDYYNVDPHFGTNEQFAELRKEIRQRDMRLILDAVVNHTSVTHEWFDINNESGVGAYANPDSNYRDYYFFEGDTNKYVGWNGVKSLPVLNFRNPALKEHIYAGENSVLKHWLKPPYSIDGWRLDVIHMLGEGEGAKNNAHYVKEFRKAIKQENPDAYVLGEHFFEATQWLQGDQEDGAMNYYGFAHPMRAWLANQDIAYDPIQLSIPEFVDWLMESKAKVPFLNQLTQLNQLDSHDTWRFLTLLNGDERKMKLAASMLFTYVGTPCLYYGTEVGLEGEGDPDCRRCFPWERVENSSWLPFFKKLISIRKNSPELQQGAFILLDCSKDYLVYARQLDGQATIVALAVDAGEIVIPIWKLGIESGEVASQIDGGHTLFDNGTLTVQLDVEQAQILRVCN